MNIPAHIIVIVLIIFTFLTSTSIYFYNKSKPKATSVSNEQSFDGEVPTIDNQDEIDSRIAELTEPAQHRGRVTYPEHVYTIVTGDTLFGIGVKFSIRHQLIVLANGFDNENIIQAGKQLVIPVLNARSDYYRIKFIINEDNASELNRSLRGVDDSEMYDPILSAKKLAVPYFGVSETDDFRLIEQDLNSGTALVEAKSVDRVNQIGLYQPKTKGEKGFWALLYIEHHD